MKKIFTLSVLLGTLLTNAQNFPTPYCNITEVEEVEEITQVSLNGTVITNNNTTDIVVNKTSTVINLTKGQQYTITVKGNTAGNFENDIFFFIDYNQNNQLTEIDENIYVGYIYNENGTANSLGVTSDPFTVPTTATLGNTRARVLKVYGDYYGELIPIDDPCNIIMYDYYEDEYYYSYGQALDFTVNILDPTASLEENVLTNIKLFPNPAYNYINITSPANFSKVEITNVLGQQVLTKNLSNNSEVIDISTLQSGTYLVKTYTQNNFTKTLKFVKK